MFLCGYIGADPAVEGGHDGCILVGELEFVGRGLRFLSFR